MKKTLVALVISGVVASSPAVAYSGDNPQIIERGGVVVSKNDYRAYQTLVLDNGLTVLLVSDPKTDKAAAALNVSVGSGSDPENFNGLAHFLEHMLFLGTKKYPQSGDYQAFIAKHGGTHNAFTAYRDTNYYFDVEANAFEGALDRFSHFFIDPLFTAEYVDREKHAVHSEYQSKLRDDFRRAYDIFKQQLNSNHPLAKFSVGSLETLADKEESARDAMLKFYQQHYSANLMNLVMVSPLSIEQMTALAKKYFSPIVNYHRQAFSETAIMQGEAHLFNKESLPFILDIKPLKASQSLSLNFPVPNVQKHYQKIPTGYLAALIGDEGEGSLLAYLKSQGLANGLSAGAGFGGVDEQLFSISVNLTQKGFENQQQVIDAIFGYLNLVKEKGIEQWRFDEQKRLSEQGFINRQVSVGASFASNVANTMAHLPLKDVFFSSYAAQTFDPDLINDYLDRLTPNNMYVVVSAPQVKTDKVGKHFGGEYAKRSFDIQRVKPLASSLFALPKPNPFIADQAVKTDLKSANTPVNLSDRPELSFWYLPNIEFDQPRAYQYISFQGNVSNQSARTKALTSLLSAWAKEASNEFSYPALKAGLNYEFYVNSIGMSLKVSGYDAKQALLLEKLLDTLLNAPISKEQFALVKESLEKGWKNTKQAALYSQILSKSRVVVNSPSYFADELLDASSSLTAEDLSAFRDELFKEVYVQAFVAGNMSKADAQKTLDLLNTRIQPRLTYKQVERVKTVKLDKNEYFRPKIEHNDTAWLNYIQSNGEDYATRALWLVYAHLISPAFYTQLRTQEQLGYIVHAGSFRQNDVAGLLLLVQSPQYDSGHIQKQADKFLQDFAQRVAQMTADEFAGQKQGLLSQVLEKDKTLAGKASRVWGNITDDYYDEQQLNADAIEAVTLEQVQNFAKEITKYHRLRVDYDKGATWFDDPNDIKKSFKTLFKGYRH